jgi:hypothetical protein
MEKWLRKNLKYITLILLVLLLLKTTQSCNRKMSLRITEKNLSEVCDSLLMIKDQVIMEKTLEINAYLKNQVVMDYYIKDLENELKIAGVKVDAAERRANAIQQTAEKIRTNTTIEIKGAEQDTSKIKK